jgi:hypothetical protein
MHGHVLTQTLLSGPGGPWLACLPLLVFCGLLRPLVRCARLLEEPRRAPRWSRQPPCSLDGDNPGESGIRLTPIELALIAELNLEQARSHEEVASDPDRAAETRLAAARAASEWRARATLFHQQAQRQSAEPVVPRQPAALARSGACYVGPERRRHTRRSQSRRVAAASGELERRERQDAGDRRRGDRRRPQLASR